MIPHRILLLAAGALSFAARPEQDPKARAQELVSSGNEFYAKKEYQAALALFERAFAVYPSPIIHYNIARSHHILGDLVLAADDYEKFLAESGVKPDSERHRLATRGLAEIEAQVGRIVLRSVAVGAEVRLDGQPLDPVPRSLRVLPGAHEIVSTAPGHAPFRASIEVGAGESTTIEIVLARIAPAIAAPPSAPSIAVTAPVIAPEEGGPITEAWWFWAVLGTGAAVAAGVAVAVSAGGREFSASGELDRSSTSDWESF